MFNRIRQLLQEEKGQSLTEWALVAVFAVGLFFLFRDSALLSMAKDTYNNVGSYLSSASLPDYGTMSNTELRQKVSNDVRIAMDDTTLRNIARAFLGKTEAQVKEMMLSSKRNSANFKPYNPTGKLNQGNLLFDYYIRDTGDGEGNVRTEFNNGLVAKDNLLNWMQGNYTDYPSNKKTLESDNRYFFSNDLIDPSGVLNGTAHQAGEYAVSVRCTFDYDAAGNVNSVRIWATRNKKDDYSNNWIRNETDGLVGIVVSK